MPKRQDGTAMGWYPGWWKRDLATFAAIFGVLGLVACAVNTQSDFATGNQVVASVQLVGPNCYIVISFDHLAADGNVTASLIPSDCEKIRKLQAQPE